MDKHVILGVHITDRMKKSGEAQRVFSEHGCNIKTRLGLHEVNDRYCSAQGIVLLELYGEEGDLEAMERKLAAIEGVEVQKMVFAHRHAQGSTAGG